MAQVALLSFVFSGLLLGLAVWINTIGPLALTENRRVARGLLAGSSVVLFGTGLLSLTNMLVKAIGA